jgi:hypothetical protein
MKYGFSVIFLLVGTLVYANEWEVDVSQCVKVAERFFFNDKENKLNSPVDYYDKNGNHVLRVFFNENGEERYRGVYKYNDLNEMIEYSSWDRSSVSHQWQRWMHGIIEKAIEYDRIVYYEKVKRYFDDYQLVRTTIKDKNGRLISDEESDEGYYYREYNERSDVIFAKFEHEKSDGMREETYALEYDERFNKTNIKAYEQGKLVYETRNTYNENDLLLRSVTINYSTNTRSEYVCTYDAKNNLIEKKYLDENGNETFIYYNQYDEENRIIKKGEKTKSYERYWIYEYSSAHDD